MFLLPFGIDGFGGSELLVLIGPGVLGVEIVTGLDWPFKPAG